MKLLYWDIDGTLLNTGHAGLNATKEVLRDLNGEDTPVPKIDAGGRTDNYICQQLLYKSTGVMRPMKKSLPFAAIMSKKLLKWLKRKAHEGVILPNAAENLAFFHGREGYRQLLLTGNSRVGASLKMDFFGLSQYFDFDHSGFAFDYYYRDDLARNALLLPSGLGAMTLKPCMSSAIRLTISSAGKPLRPDHQRRYRKAFLR